MTGALNLSMHICRNVDFLHRVIFLKPILVLSRSCLPNKFASLFSLVIPEYPN